MNVTASEEKKSATIDWKNFKILNKKQQVIYELPPDFICKKKKS